MVSIARVTEQTQHKILIKRWYYCQDHQNVRPSRRPRRGVLLKRPSFGLMRSMDGPLYQSTKCNQSTTTTSINHTDTRTHVQVSVIIDGFDGGISISYSHIEIYWWALDTLQVSVLCCMCALTTNAIVRSGLRVEMLEMTYIVFNYRWKSFLIEFEKSNIW